MIGYFFFDMSGFDVGLFYFDLMGGLVSDVIKIVELDYVNIF